MGEVKPRFFKRQEDWRRWLLANHDSQAELWVAYYKKHTGKPSLSWPESVDEALCFGWIDGLRRSIDEGTYRIRFTPRKPDSHWSGINIRRMQQLIEQGLAQQPGLDAFARRSEKRSRQAPYEQKSVNLAAGYKKRIEANADAWRYYTSLTPYRKKCYDWWVMNAKRESTRERRLSQLIDYSARGELLPGMIWQRKKEN